MLSGSALLRVSLLLVLAGALAAIVQFAWLSSEDAPSPPAPPTVTARPSERRSEPPPASTPPPESRSAPREVSPTTAAPERVVAPVQPQPMPEPASPLPSPPVTAQPEPAPADRPVEERAPPAVALVDLNTGTLTELNKLRGGGSIGRAIIKRRPYTSIDQLLSKRVLARGTYDRIKDQVVVR